jgi:hypothetical protein
VPFSKTFAPGEILTAANVNDHLLNGGYQFRETVYFTSSGTFTKATYPWLRAIRVKVQGAGGAGGGAVATASNNSGGGGGGAGAYLEKFITDIAGLDASVTVTRGAGGVGGLSTGGNGAASSFDTLTADGGVGGVVIGASTTLATPQGGTGGAAPTGGDLNIPGARGDFSVMLNSVLPFGGNGAQSVLGTGGDGQRSTNGSAGVAGGGGGGVANATSQSARDGGNGGNGIVIVDLFG